MLQTLTAIAHPQIDPVLISLGPLQIHWYGVAYVVGILFGLWYVKKMVTKDDLWGPKGSPITAPQIDDFLVWAVIGIVLGGRIGYILFYDLPSYVANPLKVFAVWEGGMSFHGGLAGITLAMFLYARKNGFNPFSLFDVIAASCGIGLFLGRVTNFINAELFGRVTDAPWGVIFPGTDGLPRHPSQLYEGLLEGLLMFTVVAICIWRFKKLQYPGFVTGIFMGIYGASRIFVEFFREPDPQLGFLLGTNWLTMGMILSLPVLAIGIWATTTSSRRVAA